MQYTRIPVLIAVVLFIVAGSILNLSYIRAGAMVLLVTFIYLSCIVILITYRCWNYLNKAAQKGLKIVMAALPLYAVRVIYLLLVEFGDIKFDPILGDWRFIAVMGLAMESGIVVLLITAGVVLEPLSVENRTNTILPTAVIK